MTQDQADDRVPAPSFTPASATRADIPRQTEFRLVSPAPDSAATPTTPVRTVPGQVVHAADDDDGDSAAAGGNLLADGEELMPGAYDTATDDSTADDSSAHDSTAHDYAGDDSAGRDGTAGDPEPLSGGPGDAEPLADGARDEELPAPGAGHDEPLLAGQDDAPLLSGVEELRAGWQRVRIAFVDNPRGAVAEAAGLADEAAEALAAALRERRDRIRDTWDGDGPARDTEALRVALLRYQALFGKIVGD